MREIFNISLPLHFPEEAKVVLGQESIHSD